MQHSILKGNEQMTTINTANTDYNVLTNRHVTSSALF